MRSWKGSRLGKDQWEDYTQSITNTPLRFIHNLDIPETNQVFSVIFRHKESKSEVLSGPSYYFNGESGPKFYITEFDRNQFTIELRPDLGSESYEYIIELREEEPDQPIRLQSGESIDSQGKVVSYRFDLGDGFVSEWSTSRLIEHIYEKPGTYEVRSQASAEGLNSYWSDPLEVHVYDLDFVVPTPPPLVGDSLVQLNLIAAYQMSGDPILDGSYVFRVNWGDGTISDWTQYNSFSHSWKSVGNYKVTCQAKSAVGYPRMSQWSEPLVVTVSMNALLQEDLEKLSLQYQTPEKKTQLPIVDTGTNSNRIVKGSKIKITVPRPPEASNLDFFEFRVNYGNGIVSDYKNSNEFYYQYNYEGDYRISCQLRKRVLVSGIYQWEEYSWSDQVAVYVRERVISTPETPISLIGVTEIKSRRAGVSTDDPKGETFLSYKGRKWISDYQLCPGLGEFLIPHGLKEYPYLVYIDFDLDGDKELRFLEKRYILEEDETGNLTSVLIKQQVGGGVPVIFHKRIKSVTYDNLGQEMTVTASRYRILVRA